MAINVAQLEAHIKVVGTDTATKELAQMGSAVDKLPGHFTAASAATTAFTKNLTSIASGSGGLAAVTSAANTAKQAITALPDAKTIKIGGDAVGALSAAHAATGAVGAVPTAKQTVLTADSAGALAAAQAATGAIGGVPTAKQTILAADSGGVLGAVQAAIGAIGGVPTAKQTILTADSAGALGPISAVVGAAGSIPSAVPITVTADTAGAIASLDAVKTKATEVDSALLKSVKSSAGFGAGMIGMASAGAAVTTMFTNTVGAAAGYEKQMNILQAVSGSTGSEMQAVGKKAIALGNDITLPGVSAKGAAAAMTELAKSGLSVNETMAAAQGVLQLGTAGQIAFADAASITANALNSFKLKGDEAVRVADLLAAGSNASSASVQSLALGMQASSAVFALGNQKVEALVTSLGMMANAGIAGSDAGTSLKTMMLSLMAPTDVAANAMKSLGINVRDSNGAILPMQALIQEFTSKVGGLGEAQRDAALKTIFGTDAFRAAAVVMLGGVDAYEKQFAATTKTGAAAELAGSQMKGAAGGFAALTSQLETLGLVAGEKVIPALTAMLKFTNDLVAATAGGEAKGGGGFIGKILGENFAEQLAKFQAAKQSIEDIAAAYERLNSMKPGEGGGIGGFFTTLAEKMPLLSGAKAGFDLAASGIEAIDRQFGLGKFSAEAMMKSLVDTGQTTSEAAGKLGVFKEAQLEVDTAQIAVTNSARRQQEAVNAAAAAASAAASAAAPAATNIGALAEMFGKTAKQAEDGVNWMKEFSGRMSEIAGQATPATAASSALGAALNVVTTSAAGIVASKAPDALKLFGDRARDALSAADIAPAAAEKIGGFLSAIEKGDRSKATMEGLSKAIADAKAPVDALASSDQSFLKWQQSISEGSASVSTSVGELVSNMKRMADDFLIALGRVPVGAEAAMTRTKDAVTIDLSAPGAEAALTYAGGFGQQVVTIEGAATTAGEALLAKLGLTVGPAGQVGVDTSGKYAGGISSGAGGVTAAAIELGNVAVAGFGAAYARAIASGASIAEGVAAGMRANIGLVNSAGTALAEAAISSSRVILRTDSPSKVFIEIGENVGEGLAIGITNEVGTVEAASVALAEASTSGFANSASFMSELAASARELKMPIAEAEAEVRLLKVALAADPKNDGLKKAVTDAQAIVTSLKGQLSDLKAQIDAAFGERTALEGFTAAMDAASKSVLAVGDSLFKALVDNSYAAGEGLKANIQRVIDEATKVGVPGAAAMGAEIITAFVFALQERTPEAIEAALSLINQLAVATSARSAELAAAEAAKNAQAITDAALTGANVANAMGEAAHKAAAQQKFGSIGAKLIEDITEATEKSTPQLIASIGQGVQQLQAQLQTLPAFVRGSLAPAVSEAMSLLTSEPGSARQLSTLSSATARLNSALQVIPKNFADLSPQVKTAVMNIWREVDAGNVSAESAMARVQAIIAAAPKDLAKLLPPVQAAWDIWIQGVSTGALTLEEANVAASALAKALANGIDINYQFAASQDAITEASEGLGGAMSGLGSMLMKVLEMQQKIAAEKEKAKAAAAAAAAASGGGGGGGGGIDMSGGGGGGSAPATPGGGATMGQRYPQTQSGGRSGTSSPGFSGGGTGGAPGLGQGGWGINPTSGWSIDNSLGNPIIPGGLGFDSTAIAMRPAQIAISSQAFRTPGYGMYPTYSKGPNTPYNYSYSVGPNLTASVEGMANLGAMPGLSGQLGRFPAGSAGSYSVNTTAGVRAALPRLDETAGVRFVSEAAFWQWLGYEDRGHFEWATGDQAQEATRAQDRFNSSWNQYSPSGTRNVGPNGQIPDVYSEQAPGILAQMTDDEFQRFIESLPGGGPRGKAIDDRNAAKAAGLGERPGPGPNGIPVNQAQYARTAAGQMAIAKAAEQAEIDKAAAIAKAEADKATAAAAAQGLAIATALAPIVAALNALIPTPAVGTGTPTGTEGGAISAAIDAERAASQAEFAQTLLEDFGIVMETASTAITQAADHWSQTAEAIAAIDAERAASQAEFAQILLDDFGIVMETVTADIGAVLDTTSTAITEAVTQWDQTADAVAAIDIERAASQAEFAAQMETVAEHVQEAATSMAESVVDAGVILEDVATAASEQTVAAASAAEGQTFASDTQLDAAQLQIEAAQIAADLAAAAAEAAVTAATAAVAAAENSAREAQDRAAAATAAATAAAANAGMGGLTAGDITSAVAAGVIQGMAGVGRASGGAAQGLHLVGEKGPEFARFGPGGYVWDAQTTAGMLREMGGTPAYGPASVSRPLGRGASGGDARLSHALAEQTASNRELAAELAALRASPLRALISKGDLDTYGNQRDVTQGRAAEFVGAR